MEAATAIPLANGKSQISLFFDGWALHNLLPRMNEDAFFAVCKDNPELKIEQDKNGNIIVMPPASYDSGHHEAEIIIDVGLWNRKYKLGKTFSSQTLFILPDGEKRMPDTAWISHTKDATLSRAERSSFAHVVPDFVVEMVSPSDNSDTLRKKMRQVWIANGVQLAWMIDPKTQKAQIFRADGSEQNIDGFDQTLSGEAVMPGFEFDLSILKNW